MYRWKVCIVGVKPRPSGGRGDAPSRRKVHLPTYTPSVGRPLAVGDKEDDVMTLPYAPRGLNNCPPDSPPFGFFSPGPRGPGTPRTPPIRFLFPGTPGTRDPGDPGPRETGSRGLGDREGPGRFREVRGQISEVFVVLGFLGLETDAPET